MKQTYKVFTKKEQEVQGCDYFQECVDNEIVNLVVTKKRKYATVSWDIITLNNSKQMVENSKECSLGNDIRELYEAYITRVNFKKKDLSYVVLTGNGFIYIYNEDIDDVLSSICELINKMMDSNCLTFISPQEKYKDMPENLRKYIGNKNLGF